MSSIDYKQSGVDLEQYADAMRRIPRWLKRTHSPRVLHRDGGFAGLFQLDFSEQLFARRYEDPVLVACTDGVGTKLKIAQRCGRHESIGIDLVAMCVNDALCCGAEPLFFLDYIALAQDDPVLIESLVKGISQGCLIADCALIGGETAIMPDVYARGEYDLAGFCVGVVSRKAVIDGSSIEAGDVLVGVASSGIHANGYSLVRKILAERWPHDLTEFVPELEACMADVLLCPTTIYTQVVRRVLRHYTLKKVVHGIAHITGGGLLENVSRIIPEGFTARVDWSSWPVPPVFPWLQALGNVTTDEMRRVFNLGIGMVLVVSPYYANQVQLLARAAGVPSFLIGEVTPSAFHTRSPMEVSP